MNKNHDHLVPKTQQGYVETPTPIEEGVSDHRSMQMMRVYDKKHLIFSQPMPALTTLLYKVCDRDGKKFDEACRLISLFMDQAEKEAPR